MGKHNNKRKSQLLKIKPLLFQYFFDLFRFKFTIHFLNQKNLQQYARYIIMSFNQAHTFKKKKNFVTDIGILMNLIDSACYNFYICMQAFKEFFNNF